MKTTRFISLMLASAAITSSAFAADAAATTISLKGSARAMKADKTSVNLVVGSTIPGDTLVQVGSKSTLGLKTADDGTLFFGPNSAFRLRHKPEAGNGHMQITVLGGSVAGTFNTGANGSSQIITSAGVINTNGGSAHVTVVPGVDGAPARLAVVVTSGTITVAGPNGQPVAVAPGQAFDSATGSVAPASPAQMSVATQAVAGTPPAADAAPAQGGTGAATGNDNAKGDAGNEGGSDSAGPAPTPNLAVTADQEKREEERAVLSPNGESNL